MEEEEKETGTVLAVAQVDAEKVTSLILGMDAEIKQCNAIVVELQAGIGALGDMPTEDVKRIATDINGHYRHADESRKRFKREWQEPQKAVEAAFKEAMAPMKELVDAYKAESNKRDSALRQERYELLCAFYEEDAPTLAELVPIERFGIVRDKVSVAKSWSLVKAQETLHAQLVQALSDWAALKTSGLQLEKEAEAEFFRTLSLQAALNLNAMRTEEQTRIDQLNAEMGVAPEPEAEAEPMPQPEPMQQEARQPQQPQPQQEAEEPRSYVITVSLTTAQRTAIVDYMRANGIHGTIREEVQRWEAR